MTSRHERRKAASLAKGYPSPYFEAKTHRALKEFSSAFDKVFHGKSVQEIERAGNAKLLQQFVDIWTKRDENGIPERGSGDHAAFSAQLMDFYDDYVDDYPDEQPPDLYDEFWSGEAS